MPTDIMMPKLGLTMEEGTVMRWLAAEGERIMQGQPLLEVETDKVIVEVEAPASGVIGQVLVNAGEKAPVGAPLARLYVEEEADERKKEEARRKIFSSPRARWRARGLGVDWRVLAGSGPAGRVIERDVLAAGKRHPAPTKSFIVPPPSSFISGSAPPLHLNVEAFAEALLDLHARLLPVVEKRTGVQLTVTDLLARICGAALAQLPRANASWGGDHIALHPQVDVGIAAVTDAGLVVPAFLVRDAGRKSLSQITAERAALVEKAQRGALAPEDLAGPAFTLANLGMFRVDSFQPVLNSSQSAILAVGRIAERPAAVEGRLAVRQTVFLTLACDHRVFDTVLAAQLLDRVVDLIEEPYGLI